MILDALETIRQSMRNPYIQGKSQTNQATKPTKVVEGSPLELEELSSTVEITNANEVTLLELIPQQKIEVEDSPLELEDSPQLWKSLMRLLYQNLFHNKH